MPLKTPELTKFSTASPVVASYNFEELASGVKYVQFYLTQTINQSGNETFLTSTLTEGAAYDQGATPQTLDSPLFEFPRTVKGGPVYFFCSFSSTVGGADVNTVKLQKWDGSTATDITEAKNSATLGTGNSTVLLKLDITAETHIPQGQQLRLIFQIGTSGGTNKVLGTVADPASVYVPFRSDE